MEFCELNFVYADIHTIQTKSHSLEFDGCYVEKMSLLWFGSKSKYFIHLKSTALGAFFFVCWSHRHQLITELIYFAPRNSKNTQITIANDVFQIVCKIPVDLKIVTLEFRSSILLSSKYFPNQTTWTNCESFK